jgi:hypothetical protein
MWTPGGPVSLRSESRQEIRLELGGLQAGGNFRGLDALVVPQRRTEVDSDLYALTHLWANMAPTRRMALRWRGTLHIINPNDWQDIWVQGARISFLGWMGRDEFRRRATLLAAGSRVFQLNRTTVRNLALPARELRPLKQMLQTAVSA